MAQSYIQVPPNSTKSSDSPQLSPKHEEPPGRARGAGGLLTAVAGRPRSRWFLWLIFDS